MAAVLDDRERAALLTASDAMIKLARHRDSGGS